MKGCLKVFAYIIAGLVVLAIIAAVVSPKKSDSATAGASGKVAAAPAVPATATPEWMAGSFSEICGSNSNITAIQQEEKVKKLAGKKVVDWAGKVYDVQHDGDKYKVSVNMQDGIIKTRDVEIVGVAGDVATKLNVDQPVLLNGTIQKIDVAFGVVCNPMTLADATIATR